MWTPDNRLGPDPAEEGCEECGDICAPGRTLCRWCLKQKQYDEDEDRSDHGDE